MVDDEQERYPTPGSYAAELFGMDEDEFEERYERAYANFEPEDVTGGGAVIHAPGPEGLAELVYRLRRTGEGWDVLVTAERPPEPRFTELVRAYRQAFGDRETRRFDDLRSALGREDVGVP